MTYNYLPNQYQSSLTDSITITVSGFPGGLDLVEKSTEIHHKQHKKINTITSNDGAKNEGESSDMTNTITFLWILIEVLIILSIIIALFYKFARIPKQDRSNEVKASIENDFQFEEDEVINEQDDININIESDNENKEKDVKGYNKIINNSQIINLSLEEI